MTGATEVSALERAAYQKAARTILNWPLITEIYPNAEALPLVRRWAAPLRQDLAELFDYRLELTPTTARLVRTRDTLDASQPAAGRRLGRTGRSTGGGTPTWPCRWPCWAGPAPRSRCPSSPNGSRPRPNGSTGWN